MRRFPAGISRGAGNNRAVSTATASSFLNNDAPLEGSGRGWSAPAEWVAGAGGLLPGLPASVPLGLPRIPGSSIRAGVEPGICLVRQNVRKSRSGSARRRRRSERRPDSTAAIVSSPARRARASSPASLAMRFSTAATRARPAATLAVPGQSSPGRRCGSRSPRRGPGPAPRPFPLGLLQPPCRPRTPCQDSPLPPACPDPLVDRHPPIVPAVFRKLDAVAVLTARLLPAPFPSGPAGSARSYPAGPASGSGRLGGGVVVDGADERLDGGVERLDAAGGAAEDQRALERRDGQVGQDRSAVGGDA
jgi:hypothetical protein